MKSLFTSVIIIYYLSLIVIYVNIWFSFLLRRKIRIGFFFFKLFLMFYLHLTNFWDRLIWTSETCFIFVMFWKQIIHRCICVCSHVCVCVCVCVVNEQKTLYTEEITKMKNKQERELSNLRKELEEAIAQVKYYSLI